LRTEAAVEWTTGGNARGPPLIPIAFCRSHTHPQLRTAHHHPTPLPIDGPRQAQLGGPGRIREALAGRRASLERV